MSQTAVCGPNPFGGVGPVSSYQLTVPLHEFDHSRYSLMLIDTGMGA